ncbi:stage V sporulation protein D [Virgibacillus pantothenticus]|uniref:serine-type D-Ala-D-Ala carboxypeptidase n=1 Tax=Virgibacillus pantothenticus TaxID=1473 RepID=A0A0L0QNE6_VIRPA|nr:MULTISPECIES: stage V sporulation protein D [Virgibacillus]API93794.1 stage V sporulation protein D [Virgibacillus sp. 6R]KNE20081.1 stage V sporulation protein D [Virgibacillus pantothenticus]MBS7429789.1 stage V sporulation protein D [Virgibacillus sp. 19R1-5]MBU8565117.1 stage V sporulation protein D [Virgibacillus pantothenticus]MBU8601063.1 stage V sporulation protein D [Virgibacillus pantothenticus]
MKRVSAVTTKKRIVAVFLIGLLVYVIIDIRLGYVQFVIGDDLTGQATELWTRDIEFEPERGKILDNHGEVLAENVTAPSVVVVPRQVDEPKQTAQKLASILEMPEDEAFAYVTKNASSVNIHPEGRKINEKQEMAIRTLDMNGVYLSKDSKRHYPYGDDLSHVLGFAGIDNQGLMGLELYYDEQLSGEKGSLSFYSDAKGRRLERLADVYSEPKDGLDLKTTIDTRVQTIMERELDLVASKYNPDGAVAIAVNPKTGGVLGMTSRPNFHPENYQEVDADIFDRNLPIWSTYEPGSTFKIITLAAALEEGVVDLHNDHYHDDGDISVGGSELHCWKSGGHGHQSYLEVVQNSCNPGFVSLGQMLGKEKLFSYIDQFGFGKKTGIDLQGEGTGILFKPEKVGPVELATTAFGQGVSVTPIQQVMAVSAAVNGGYLYEPYIAEEWIDPKTSSVQKQVKPVMKKRVISEATSKEIRQALESVVAQGTGRPAYVDGYRVGGKTGTAQKVGPDGRYMKNNYVVSFIGFAPADDPEIVVYVAVDNPKNAVQFGGVVAAPVVGRIIGDSLRAMEVKPRTEGLEKDYQWPEQPKVEVPDVVGLKRKELQEYMTNLSIETSGKGDYIVDQAPKPGTKVEQGAKIRIYLAENDR